MRIWPVLGTLLAAVLVAACSSGSSPEAVESESVTDDGTNEQEISEPPADDDTTTSPENGETTTPSDDGADGTQTSEPGGGQQDALDWGECDEDDQALMGTVECTTLEVPLDYEQPNGETIGIALVRVPATDEREGALLTNPGGPGGSGVDLVVNAGSRFHGEMGLTQFDIIGFDPRGVDRSNEIECLPDEVLDDYLYVDWNPDTPEEERHFEESKDVLVEGCQEKYDDELIHYSTENTARDMDAIRDAMGDDEISYLGISYGTYLGATYATMFPDNVRALVLDAAFEPTDDNLEQQWLTQVEGFEQAFDNWAEWCADDGDACPFSESSADDVGARWDDLYDELDEDAVTVEGRDVNQSTLMTATLSSMYEEMSWRDLAGALADAEAGDVEGILRLADQYHQRNADGTFASIRQSGPVIRCASGLTQDEPDQPREFLELMHERAPRFARDMVAPDSFDNQCAELVGERVEPPELSYDGDAPILVVGGENDPATPFRWAEELDESMGDSSVLMSYTGEGHGAVFASECATEIEASVITDLELPDEGTSCDADPHVEEPEWWGDIETPDVVSDVEHVPMVEQMLIGGPSEAYSEVRLTQEDPGAVHQEYVSLLEDAGFSAMMEATELPGLDGIEASYITPPSGDMTLLVVTVPPEAVEDNDVLDPLAGAVPDGETAVVVAAAEVM